MYSIKFLWFFLFLVFCCTLPSCSQSRFDDVKITTTKLTEDIYMLQGSGGNIMIAVSEDKVLMIDSQYAPLSEKIKDAIGTITTLPISYLINTHHHGDHTGGNEKFNSENTTIIGHSNVKKRLLAEDKSQGFIPEKTLEEQLELQLPNEKVLIIHVHNAHTDGDSFIYMIEDNVVHMGDVFFNGKYPFIDLQAGGSIDGYIKAQQQILAYINEDTQIIPGHGELATYSDLKNSIAMLQYLRNAITDAIQDGSTKEDIIKDQDLTSKYDKLDYGTGFISSEKIKEIIYDDLTKR